MKSQEISYFIDLLFLFSSALRFNVSLFENKIFHHKAAGKKLAGCFPLSRECLAKKNVYRGHRRYMVSIALYLCHLD